MSNRLFQGVVHQMRDTLDRVIGVVDDTATIISCSDLTRIGETSEYISLDLVESNDIFVRDGYTYKPFGTRMKPDYAVFVEGTDDMAAKFAGILAVSLSSIKQYYDEKYDRNNFIKNVILDNILPGDIYVKARELHFNTDINRVVLLIRIVSSNDISAFDVIQNLFPDKQKDFVFNISESDIVLVKEIKPGIGSKTWKSWPAPLWILWAASSTPGLWWVSVLLWPVSRIWPAPSRKPRWRWKLGRCLTPRNPLSAMTTWESQG